MMNTSSKPALKSSDRQSFKSLEYREVNGCSSASGFVPQEASQLVEVEQSTITLTEAEFTERTQQAKQLAVTETEKRLRGDYEQQVAKERDRIADIISEFQQERNTYYSAVETELVKLALAISKKILHREAQVDRMLLAGLVKVAIENLQHRSNIVVRVRPEKCDSWREYFSRHLPTTKVEILEDSQLEAEDCKLETELGTAEVGIDAQLKEVEAGFFDLLAQRPDKR
jgi:flagellar assembly protein FliH